MRSLLVTELAKLLQLDAVGVIAFVFSRRIVSLFAVCACQRDDNPHWITPPELLKNTNHTTLPQIGLNHNEKTYYKAYLNTLAQGIPHVNAKQRSRVYNF